MNRRSFEIPGLVLVEVMVEQDHGRLRLTAIANRCACGQLRYDVGHCLWG